MKFLDLYNKNVDAVQRSLISLWCSDAKSDMQKRYAEQLKQLIIKELFASEDYMPLVQSMDKYKPVNDNENNEALALIGEDLWRKATNTKDGEPIKHPPYKHQYESWRSLLNSDEIRSMVVTTGTGSGKTECFMLPLVKDLQRLDNTNVAQRREIKAIFLYPLNALMEDQKSRLHRLLAGTGLKFAVYNGNLPRNNKGEKNRRYVEREMNLYPDTIVPTRQELWSQGADIILTNPTMLEYMLLRAEDQSLFTKGSLKWIVVDEAHTFTGAAATELAMLLRRVKKAFNVNDDIHLAASSATIGNGSDQTKQEKELKRFIADIGGVNIDKVDVIKGEKVEIANDDTYRVYRDRFNGQDYIKLSDLIPDSEYTSENEQCTTIELKLKKLDQLCDNGLRAKVHYFFRVPNNGITVQLDSWKDKENGELMLKSFVDKRPEATPALELFRCSCCGEYFALGRTCVDDNNGTTYKPDVRVDADVFDFIDDKNSDKSEYRHLFGVINSNNANNVDGNSYVNIIGNTCTTAGNVTGWGIVANQDGLCPHCGSEIFGKVKKNKGQNPQTDDADVADNEKNNKLVPLRVSAEFLSRVMADPSLSEMRTKDDWKEFVHEGQQYISFVDSRMSAAKGTFQQELEVERFWAFSRIHNELLKRNDNTAILSEIARLKENRERALNERDYDALSDILIEIKKKQSQLTNAILSWQDIYDVLNNDPDSDQLCRQFANKLNDKEVHDDDTIDELAKKKYIFSVMIEQFSKYPPFSASAETMGLLCSRYEKLKDITAPNEFKIFCQKTGRLGEEKNGDAIDAEWRSLIHIYLDRVARSNETVYMKMDAHDDVDIFRCMDRFGTKKPARRTAHKPLILDRVASNIPIVQLLLGKVIAPAADKDRLRQVIEENKIEINGVIEALWKSMMDHQLLQYSMKLKKDGTWVNDEDTKEDKASKHYDELKNENGWQLRFNLQDLSFALPKAVYMCNVRDKKKLHVRPVTTLFFGYAPYNIDGNVQIPISEETWEVCPFVDGKNDCNRVSIKEISDWGQEKRKALFDNGLWGENGCFSNHLNRIYSYPKTFIQVEHTAQVEKELARVSQSLFKDHKINIMACSTTMEMGVDLGDLDLVMMSSIPPHPANYKQRAGRSGRNEGARSACITLCTSDALGLRTLLNPMEQIITRPVEVPWVDMSAKAIIQRHVNAYLLRESGVLSGNGMTSEVISCFSNYCFMRGNDNRINYLSVRDGLNIDVEIFPSSSEPLGSHDNTVHKSFLIWLDDSANDSLLSFLTVGTPFESFEYDFIENTKKEWQNRRKELGFELSSIGAVYEHAREELRKEEESKNIPTSNRKVLGEELRSKYGYYLRWKFNSVLSRKLIQYLATHRFTPNADMPVDVVEFEVYKEQNENRWDKRPSNPSYSLRQALSQYAPGNSIPLSNRIVTVAGVDFYGREDHKAPLTDIVTDGVDVVLAEQKHSLKNALCQWPINMSEQLSLVRVRAFVHDVNKSDSRELNKAPYTGVDAQLIGATPWNIPADYSHLIAVRSNDDKGTSKIMYYNDGIGFGYCLCPKCGKTVLETGPCGGNLYTNLPLEMNKQTNKEGDKNGHYSISKLTDKGKPVLCIPSEGKYKRNVILGDMIQTDFAEIRLRKNGQSWFSAKEEERSLKVTLGVVFCTVFTESIGKDRDSVDFILLPNGGLCIFDTNPGGSGYSNHLSDPHKMKEVVENSKALLDNVRSKEELFDKFTIKYIDEIDIDAARDWLNSEMETWETLPDNISTDYPNAKWTTFYDLKEDILSTSSENRESTIFVNDDWESWLYEGTNEDEVRESLKLRLQQVIKENIISSKIQLGVLGDRNIPLPIYSALRSIKTWATPRRCEGQLNSDLLPLAHTNGHLYFTDNKEAITANHDWARGNIFVVPMDEQPLSCIDVDLETLPRDYADFKIGDLDTDKTKIKSDELFDLVAEKCESKNLNINDFLISLSDIDADMKITYQDQHLKSAYGMITTLQFIKKIIELSQKQNRFQLTFQNEEYYERNGCNTNPFKAFVDDIERNEALKDYSCSLIQDLMDVDDPENFLKIETSDEKVLPHWRELIIECGEKKMSIYPNGGFINEWFFDSQAPNIKYYTVENISINDKIALYRRNLIKYDVKIDKM